MLAAGQVVVDSLKVAALDGAHLLRLGKAPPW
jgi:hypothetical protein